MKNLIMLFLLSSVLLLSCKRDINKDNDADADIYYASINKEYVLIKDVNLLLSSDDTISQHVDSIINGLLNEQIISTGLKSFDLNNDGSTDLHFEIIDLNQFNNAPLPSYLDSMAARVLPVQIQILDNTTYGYPDALTENAVINASGNWTSNNGVLGTFMNAGQFQGKGDRYLAFRLSNTNAYNYGWVKIYCSQHSDTLRIIECAYNKSSDAQIFAGQKE